MKSPHNRYSLALFSFFGASLVISAVLAQYPDCITMDRQPGTNGAAWARGAIVTVIINPTEFPTSTERQRIEDAFTAWQNANTGSGVTFRFTTGPAPAAGSNNNTHYIRRGSTSTGGLTNIANTGTPTTEGNITTSAITIIDSRITNSNAIANIMLHEIGHTFGLAHCLTCAAGSSIMTGYSTDCLCASFPCDRDNPLNGIRFGCPPLSAPRECDELAVNLYAGYPQVTPTPTPTPTPCAVNGSSCSFNLDCCSGKCGEVTGTCIPCERNLQDNHWESCMSEACMQCFNNGGVNCTGEGGNCWTPIIVDLDSNGFSLSDAARGVRFDLNADGVIDQVAWTTIDSDDAFLTLDRNENGRVDDGRELFGNFSPQLTSDAPNGFLALAIFDRTQNGGNGDSLIDRYDEVYSLLRLWNDQNHNGISEPAELTRLADAGIGAISIIFKESMRRDRWGNTFRYRAKVFGIDKGARSRWAYDVFLVH